ncbi:MULTISPECIES: TrkH family potassium uptake protein [Bacillus cereus group]|uniref:H(+)-transporting two-sector ATPase n=1 Tax=Bacillus cytotoxicus (strain DSM 22905 / CIP 110041 / 391-98 / NVH 391-98) TaxID=315749 RepID=A7GML3_BACCN|nr:MULTISPECIES: TrkH family potassium uptake protein [Bacillus cereus group]ABS21371.1 H(+)-transporting two-sector ATPase [Bacillus cytotoxicus NVH 391-98]AWC28020.1 Ktr system potassium uptake protein D [Bacillus cytotoxicus]AWC40598.1 Ktr system potassium uptake protein D [Bacillus cytotoxicus]AWC44085.1 Ktr system potassium uptake protein D [Bacillus cytotoxicus]AWC48529.1 Ktr system potassium uptake protein D [Bacillus cytotoxicus]
MKGIKKFLQKLRPVQLIVFFYFIAVIVSVILLSMPFVIKPGVKWTFIDALFTSVSAVSVTGLSVVSIPDTFNTVGIIVLAFVLQLGGLGIMALGTFLWILTGKKIGLQRRRLIMADHNQGNLSGLVELMRSILIVIISIELVGALLLGTRFLNYFSTWQEAYFHGFFAAISATTNGGFDLTGQSLIPYQKDYIVQIIHMLLIILGAIGFPVLMEIKQYISKRKHQLFRFSLFTKLTTTTFFALIVVGTIVIILLEQDRFFTGKSWHETLFYALFQSVTTRSGGLATMDIRDLSQPTLLFMSVLMFIGASPSSVGGGIRTTTFAVNILSLYSFAKGGRTVRIFKRQLHEEDILKASVVMTMGILLCASALFILSITETAPLMKLIVEVCSAFGTTGLSTGITSDLTTVGKCVLIVLMFIGRVGILTFILASGGREQPPRYKYPKERIIIG